jgi:hypothetical protein
MGSSEYLYHGPCPQCGSKDNRAFYSTGSSYCFGCRHYFPSKTSPYLVDRKVNDPDDVPPLPDDADRSLGYQSVQWAGKYGLSTEELLTRGCLWSERKQQLIFPWYDDTGRLILWQSRNFSPLAKSKALTYGKSKDVLPIYPGPGASESRIPAGTLAIVEDPISAIKTARYVDSMPCLGSDIPTGKITRLARFYGLARVWLDGNMYPNAQRIARRLEMLGVETKAVWTDKDPKEHSDKEILDILS